MGPGATLDSFEISEAHAAVARESFRRAGFEGRAHVHVGPAAESLPKLEGKVDLVFIDADKVGYPAYLAWAEDALEVGGLLLADNAFGWGRVADPPGGDDARSIEALQRFAKALATSGRFRATLIPTAEGLAMGVKLR